MALVQIGKLAGKFSIVMDTLSIEEGRIPVDRANQFETFDGVFRSVLS